MLAFEPLCRFIHRYRIEPLIHMIDVVPFENQRALYIVHALSRSRFAAAGADPVHISLAFAVETRVKIRGHLLGFQNADRRFCKTSPPAFMTFSGAQCIVHDQRKFRCRDSDVRPEARPLPKCVDSRICPAGPAEQNLPVKETRHGLFQVTLHRSFTGLLLPPMESAAVICDCQKHIFLHTWSLYRMFVVQYKD